MAVLKHIAGVGMNVAQLTLFFLISVSQKFHGFGVSGHFLSMNSTFSFPQCCNVGSHGSNFDV